MTEPPSWNARLQRLTNAHPVPARRAQHWTPDPIPVTARLVWERDGLEYQAGRAVAWTTRLVLVHFDRELRLQTHGAWLRPVDVRRTGTPS